LRKSDLSVFQKWDSVALSDVNLYRRHLEHGQRAMLGERIRDAYDKMARGRMLAGKKADPVEILPQGDAGKARDHIRDACDREAKERQ
jgi:hypothetical protein